MKNSLSAHILDFKLAPDMRSNPRLIKQLSDIDKYFADDEKTKAYLLGRLVRSNEGDIIRRTDSFEGLYQYLQQKRLLRYFEGHNEMPRASKEIRNWIIFVFSVFLIVLGVVRLIGNVVDVGLSNMYNIPIVREGGLPLISGLLLLIVALTRWKYNTRRKRLKSELLSSP